MLKKDVKKITMERDGALKHLSLTTGNYIFSYELYFPKYILYSNGYFFPIASLYVYMCLSLSVGGYDLKGNLVSIIQLLTQ